MRYDDYVAATNIACNSAPIVTSKICSLGIATYQVYRSARELVRMRMRERFECPEEYPC